MERTHVLGEGKPPSLLIPRQFCDALDLDEELPLKVQELVEAGEQEMERVAIETRDRLVAVFLLGMAIVVVSSGRVPVIWRAHAPA